MHGPHQVAQKSQQHILAAKSASANFLSVMIGGLKIAAAVSPFLMSAFSEISIVPKSSGPLSRIPARSNDFDSCKYIWNKPSPPRLVDRRSEFAFRIAGHYLVHPELPSAAIRIG